MSIIEKTKLMFIGFSFLFFGIWIVYGIGPALIIIGSLISFFGLLIFLFKRF